MKLPRVRVYHDAGAGEFSRGCLVHALSNAFAGRAAVERIHAAEIVASDDWHAGTLLLAFPGGADLPYAERLDGPGNASILRYLEGGGAFLGVCAGAYYASARVAFEASEPGAITGVRELALFQGTARGSLHELAAPYALDHLRCAAVVAVRRADDGRKLHALYWGGPELVPDRDARFTPLLTYVTPDDRHALAAVRTDVGRGRAVLTGVHAEVMGCQFPVEVSRFADDSHEHGMRLGSALSDRELERQELFALQLSALGF
jgi:biotin--protein ligase